MTVSPDSLASFLSSVLSSRRSLTSSAPSGSSSRSSFAPRREAPREGYALLHATAEFVRVGVCPLIEPDELEHLHRGLLGGCSCRFLGYWTEHDVLEDGHVGKESVCLGDVDGVPLLGRYSSAFSPSMKISPSSGLNMPAIERRRVVFPLPVDPRMQRYSWSLTSKVTSSSALTFAEALRHIQQPECGHVTSSSYRL